MKKFSKILSVALLVALVLSLGITSAFADDEPAVPTSQVIGNTAANADGEYTISVKEGDTHSYKVYQILTGTLIPGESKLGNPAWGADAVGGKDNDVNAFIDSLAEEGLTNTQINDLVKAQLATNAEGQGVVDATHPTTVVPGYYLLVDVTDAKDLADGESLSLNIVAVFNDIQITPKTGTTESEKHVDDVNDSTGTEELLKNSADYDVGDTIPYTLTMTLPEDYANYKEYYVQFVDDMSAGLTLNTNSVTIKFGSAEPEEISFTEDNTATSYYTNGKVYTYTINNLKADAYKDYGLAAGSKITIEYTATLNASAVVGDAGNPNRYKVVFSNNPNHSGEGTPTNETPWDMNIVFTYKTVFDKVNGEGKPLSGANFVLYKFVASNEGAVTYKNVKGDWVDVTTLNTGAAHPTKTVDKLTNDKGEADGAKFTFSGLDDGYYKLVETETPEGYNTAADILFTVTADHQVDADAPTLATLTGTEGAEIVLTPKTNNEKLTGELDGTVVNNQGTQLPSTGGIGTTIFYVVGGVLVLAAIILLVTKKRMSE